MSEEATTEKPCHDCYQLYASMFSCISQPQSCRWLQNWQQYITTWLAVKLYYYTSKYYVVGCEIPLCEYS